MTSRSILITGCSSGIGLATATLLKTRGYRVFAAARQTSDVLKLAALGLESVQLDITDPESMQRALDQVLQLTGGTLDALFNNAAYMQAGAIEDLTPEIMRAQFETNTFGPMTLTRLVLPIMRKQGHGRIIQNSSILGVVTMPYYGAYNASKFALEAFSSTLRQELYGTNIHVSLINPGPIVSKLRANALDIYQTTIRQQPSPHHQQTYEKMEKIYFNHSDDSPPPLSLGPEAVVKKVIAALESKHPSAHYFVGRPAQLLAVCRRVLPDCVLDWLIHKIKG